MKSQQALYPLLLAGIAAAGNAIVTLGQKKASPYPHPFFFGAFSLLLAAMGLFILALFFPAKDFQKYVTGNFKWFATTALGLLLLNIFLYFLYRNYGASYYTLYAILAIFTTSILLSILFFKEKMNCYYWISIGFALLTIFFL